MIKLKLSSLTRADLEKIAQEIKEELNNRDQKIAMQILAQKSSKEQQSPDVQAGGVKYRHPMRDKLVWCGKGRMPYWMYELIESGYRKDDLRVHE